MTKQIVAFDVGGANLKLISSDGTSQSRPFPLWQQPESLATVLTEMLRFARPDARVLATMTGELADCFADKQQGVNHIVAALEMAAGGRSLEIYLTSGEFASPAAAREAYDQAAASNWHALANFVSKQPLWHNSLLIDIGSTTCDVIPVVDGQVAAQGKTDTERLLAGELVYVGAERTPIAMIADSLPYRNCMSPIAREVFATTLDLQLVLGLLPNQDGETVAADGRPATRQFAISRLGRCICADRDEWTADDAEVAARYLQTCVAELLDTAIEQVYGRHPDLRAFPIVISGHGEWLLEPLFQTQLREARRSSLQTAIGREAARAAPAYALVRLAEQMK